MELNLPVSESTPNVLIASSINPREPLELKGRNMATGKESVISLLTPMFENAKEIPSLISSNKPLFLKNEIATNIQIKKKKMVTPVVNPFLAPETKASKMVVFCSTNLLSLVKA